jgi:nuclear transcription factor Y gamma
LARIKKVMKADPEVKMISAEAPILFAKGCDIFITELTLRAWIHAEENKRRTLQRSDIASALSKSDMFDFLIDIVPREEAHPHKRSGGQNAAVQSSAVAVPPGGMPQQVHAQHPMAPPDYGMAQHIPQQEDFRQPNMYAAPDPGVYAQQQMFDQSYQAYPTMAQQQVSNIFYKPATGFLTSTSRCMPSTRGDQTRAPAILRVTATRRPTLTLRANAKTLVPSQRHTH